MIVAALIRRGIVRELLLGHPGAFTTPHSCVEEVWERRVDWNQKGAPDAQIRDDLSWLAERIFVVIPHASFRDRVVEAAALIADRIRWVGATVTL